MTTTLVIDGTLYPDMPSPEVLIDLSDRVDFLARMCAAWDFGLLPDAQLVSVVRQSSWRETVDQCKLLTSPSYHLLRQWHHLPPLSYLGQQIPLISNDPNLDFI